MTSVTTLSIRDGSDSLVLAGFADGAVKLFDRRANA